MHEFFKAYAKIWIIVASIVIGAIVIAIIIASSQKKFYDIERGAIKYSHQYIETKRSLLQSLHSDWLKLDAEIAELSVNSENQAIVNSKGAQQKAILNRMHTEAENIPSKEIPESVTAFLEKHPRF